MQTASIISLYYKKGVYTLFHSDMLISDSRNEIYRSNFGGLKKKKKSLAQFWSPQSMLVSG